MNFPALLALSASLALCLCSCGESFQKVAERHLPALEEFKADLEKIAAEVASTGDSELPLSQELDPKPN